MSFVLRAGDISGNVAVLALAHVSSAHSIRGAGDYVISAVEADVTARTACVAMIRARDPCTCDTICTGAPVHDTPVTFDVVPCVARDTGVRVMRGARSTLGCMPIIAAALEWRFVRDVKFGTTFEGEQTTGFDHNRLCRVGRRHSEAHRFGYPGQAPEWEVVFRPMLRAREPHAIVRATIAVATLWSAVTRREV